MSSQSNRNRQQARPNRNSNQPQESTNGDFLKYGLMAVGGALLGAAVAYGVKYFTDEKRDGVATSSCAEKLEKEENEKSSRSNYPSAPNNDSTAPSTRRNHNSTQSDLGSDSESTLSMQIEKKQLTLQERLLDYYEYTAVTAGELSMAMNSLQEVCHLVDNYFASNVPHVNLSSLESTCSLPQLYMVRHADEFEVPMKLYLKSGEWKATKADESFSADRYWIENSSNCALASWSNCLKTELGKLSANQVIDSFASYVKKATTVCSTFELSSALNGNKIEIEVNEMYAGNRRLKIVLIPTIILEGREFVPGIENFEEKIVTERKDMKLLWKKNRSIEKELEKLSQLEENSCHMMCLKLLLCIQKNWPQEFQGLDKRIWPSLIFHAKDREDDWSKQCLAERFIDLLKSLEEYLHCRRMPDYFDREVDLLASCNAASLENLKEFVGTMLVGDKFSELLKKEF